MSSDAPSSACIRRVPIFSQIPAPAAAAMLEALTATGCFFLEVDEAYGHALKALGKAAEQFFDAPDVMKEMVSVGAATAGDLGYAQFAKGGAMMDNQAKEHLESFTVRLPSQSDAPFPWPLFPSSFEPNVRHGFKSLVELSAFVLEGLTSRKGLCEKDWAQLGLGAMKTEDQYSASILFLRKIYSAVEFEGGMGSAEQKASSSSSASAVKAHTDSGALTLIPCTDSFTGFQIWSHKHRMWLEVESPGCEGAGVRVLVMGGEGLVPILTDCVEKPVWEEAASDPVRCVGIHQVRSQTQKQPTEGGASRRPRLTTPFQYRLPLNWKSLSRNPSTTSAVAEEKLSSVTMKVLEFY